MNENFELVKDEINAMSEMEDIWENPIVKFIVNHIPFISSAVDSAVAKLIENHQKKKLEELFEIILQSNDITMDDIKDVECIMMIAKTVDVVNHLIKNQKIKYLGKLLKNSIKDRERNIDEFEELLNKLSNLSIREIDMLFLLSQEEERNSTFDNNGKKSINIEKSWASFVEKAKSEFDINESEVISTMLGVMRTGFCVAEWRTYLNGMASVIIYTSPEYYKLLTKI